MDGTHSVEAAWPAAQAPTAPAQASPAPRRRRARWQVWAGLPALLIVVAVVILPVGWLSWLSLRDESGFTLQHYARMLHNPGYGASLRTTLLVAALVTAASALLSYPLACLLTTLRGRAAKLVLVVVLLPFWTALLVRTFAWLVLLQRRGLVNTLLQQVGLTDRPLELVNNLTGTVIGMTHVMIPFMTLPLLAAMAKVDRRLLWASRSLGASPARAFRDVLFRLSLPGLLAGGVLVFVMSLGFYVMPALLGGGRVLMWSMKIESNINQYSDWGAASSLGVVLLAVTAVILWLSRRLTRRLVP